MSESQSEAKYLSPRKQMLSWSELSGISPTQIYPAGVELFRQGEPAQYVYFLEKGLVKTRYTDANGQELIVSLFGSPGSIVGASCAIVDKHCVTATVLCRSYVRFLPAPLFRDLLRSDARVSWRIHQLHCRILSEQITQRIQFGCLPARKRFEQLLWQLI